MSIKTGILGGTFDPLHVGHLMIANYVCAFEGLDEVWLVVSPQSPGKQEKQLTDENVRLEIVKQFTQNTPKIKCCDVEYRLPRPSYMISTIRQLKTDYPEREFVLLIGADQLLYFDKWYKSDEILQEVELLVYNRRGSENQPKINQKKIKCLNVPLIEISSTFIRESIRQKRDIRCFLPHGEFEYLMENKISYE